MSFKKCHFENSECPLYWREPPPNFDNETGCYSDIHHEFWQSTLRTALERVFGELPENLTQECRAEHERRHREEQPPELPSREYMLGRVILALTENELYLSRNKQKKIFGQ